MAKKTGNLLYIFSTENDEWNSGDIFYIRIAKVFVYKNFTFLWCVYLGAAPTAYEHGTILNPPNPYFSSTTVLFDKIDAYHYIRYHRSGNSHRKKVFVDQLQQQKLNKQNILPTTVVLKSEKNCTHTKAQPYISSPFYSTKRQSTWSCTHLQWL